jgi:hypothetical protein
MACLTFMDGSFLECRPVIRSILEFNASRRRTFPMPCAGMPERLLTARNHVQLRRPDQLAQCQARTISSVVFRKRTV